MQIPINCPICNDPLLNTYVLEQCIKSCTNKLNHKFSCSLYNEIWQIKLQYDSDNIIVWFPVLKEITLCKGNWNTHKLGKNESIPYFEPDFSNFKALVIKIKMLILFS